MSNRVLQTGNSNNIAVSYKDMGDGTFAEIVYTQAEEAQAITITGKVIDSSKTIQMNFEDGTSQSIYFDSTGEWAGRSARV